MPSPARTFALVSGAVSVSFFCFISISRFIVTTSAAENWLCRLLFLGNREIIRGMICLLFGLGSDVFVRQGSWRVPAGVGSDKA
jgi:prolipoprotein diacylglyceryltransferase